MLQDDDFIAKNSLKTIERYEPNQIYNRLSMAHIKGGIHMNKENDEKIREVFKSILKKIGKKILEGKFLDVMKISKPIEICHPLCFLECIANDYVYFPTFLKLAALTNDPVKRLKYVVVAAIAGYHQNGVILKHKAPLDALLGETFQAKKSDGSHIYIEQTTGNPPKSSYLLVGPENLYRLYGSGEITANLSGVNALIGDRVGKTTIIFKDNTEIQITNPSMEVSGLIMGDRILNFIKTVYYIDKKNCLIAELTFNKKKSGFGKLSSAVSRFFKKDDSKPNITDNFDIIIYSYAKPADKKNDQKLDLKDIIKIPICEGSGSWLEYVEFEGEIFWKIDDAIEPWETDMPNLLPSNSLLRGDWKNLKENNVSEADREKNQMEEMIFYDEKLRKRNKKNK